MTSKGNAAEGVKKFADLVKSSSVIPKLQELQQLLSGPLKICREKLQTLETEEAESVLSRVDPNYQKELIENVGEIFVEEVESGKRILEEIDCILSELQTILENLNQRLEEECRKEFDSKSPAIVLNLYEDCRSILTFLKLKTSIFRTHLAIPFDESADPNPLAHCANISVQEENFMYLLCKISELNLDV